MIMLPRNQYNIATIVVQYSSISTWLLHACDKYTTLHVFQITRCMHACSLKIDDVWMLVKSIMSTSKCTRCAIFCRVSLLKHAHEWLSCETLEYCSANYCAIYMCSTLNANVIERRRLQLWDSTPDLVAQALMDWISINTVAALEVSR